jgi:hypothetical protein
MEGHSPEAGCCWWRQSTERTIDGGERCRKRTADMNARGAGPAMATTPRPKRPQADEWWETMAEDRWRDGTMDGRGGVEGGALGEGGAGMCR